MNSVSLSSKPGPIAVFDSGYGGLTVLEHLVAKLPEYDFIYLGDNARTPYGTRSFDIVYQYTLQGVRHLFEMGAHLVILACNTASAKALRTIQQNDLPNIDPNRRVLGVIRPSVEVVSAYSKSKHIGVFGTPGTVQSNSYPLELLKIDPDLVVVQEACPMWVPLVENGEATSEGADYFVHKHVEALLGQDSLIDLIVLGCTHYPVLLPKIKPLLPFGVNILNQGEVVANSLFDYLKRHPDMASNCSKGGAIRFFTTENPDKFEKMASLFFQGDIQVEKTSYY